jgi:hypothetical protein
LIADNPAAGIKAPTKEVSRERVLSLDELKDVLVAAQRMGYPTAPVSLKADPTVRQARWVSNQIGKSLGLIKCVVVSQKGVYLSERQSRHAPR